MLSDSNPVGQLWTARILYIRSMRSMAVGFEILVDLLFGCGRLEKGGFRETLGSVSQFQIEDGQS